MHDIPRAESSLHPKHRSNGPQNRGGGVLHVGEWHEVEVDVFFLSLVNLDYGGVSARVLDIAQA